MKIEGTVQVFRDTFQSNSRHKMYTTVNIHILDFVPLIQPIKDLALTYKTRCTE
jgi:hypothetical protein